MLKAERLLIFKPFFLGSHPFAGREPAAYNSLFWPRVFIAKPLLMVVLGESGEVEHVGDLH